MPEGFQRAQFQLEHGFVDAIVERKDLKMTLYRILKIHQKTEGYANFDPLRSDDCYEPTEVMKERATKAQPLSAWEKVRAARRADRLASVDYMTIFLTTSWNFPETDSSRMILRLWAVLPTLTASRSL